MALLKIHRKGETKDLESAPILGVVPLSSDKLGITKEAANRICELISQKEDAAYLRVAIRGGGCSGLSIHYEFASAPKDNDVIFEENGSKIIIDKKSLSILGGATLHCKEHHGSKEFVLLNNPAAKQCSCGQSFAL